MKQKKGVTLISLSIYVVVATILLGTLSFVNANLMSNLALITKRSKLTNEMVKFYSFFVKDVKSTNGILEFSDDFIRFDNGVKYRVRYRSNTEIGDANQTYDIYEVYRNDALITDKLSGIFFEYDDEAGYVKVRLFAQEDDIIENDEQYFKLGRGY